MTVYEFQVMSSTMSCEASDDKIAVASALWWSSRAPAINDDVNLSPMHLFGLFDDEGAKRMDSYFEGNLEKFFEVNGESIKECCQSILPFGKDKREAMERLLSTAKNGYTPEEREAFIKEFSKLNGTY